MSSTNPLDGSSANDSTAVNIASSATVTTINNNSRDDQEEGDVALRRSSLSSSTVNTNVVVPSVSPSSSSGVPSPPPSSSSSVLPSLSRSPSAGVHRISWFFLQFVDKDTEARFIEYRYAPIGFAFLCVLSCIFAFMNISTTFATFEADTVKVSPTKWFFENPSWQGDEFKLPRVWYFSVSGITSFGVVVAVLYNLVVRKGAPVTGKYLQWLCLFTTFLQWTLQTVFDYRFDVFCHVNEFSLLLRDPVVPTVCEDYVEPYTPIQHLSTILLSPPLKFIFLLFYMFFLPSTFLFRWPVMKYDYLFRTSDAVWFFSAFIYLIAFVYNEYSLRQHFIQREVVQREVEHVKRAQTTLKRLLDAMLPTSVLKRLIKNEAVSDSGVVSVVFSDVANFTGWCSAQKAEAVVWMLNTMYSRFDNSLQRYGIEKIKTIGDAYWAVCGLPDPNPEHILRICAFAQYIQRTVSKMPEDDPNHNLRVRVGVHTGNACGGLVGSNRSSYDMFGTTNEVAEQMEQRSPVGSILLSEKACRYLKRDYRSMIMNRLNNNNEQDEMTAEDGGMLLTPRSTVSASSATSNSSAEVGYSVELYDEALDTVQGQMTTYLLKSFTWMPPPPTMEGFSPSKYADEHDDEEQRRKEKEDEEPVVPFPTFIREQDIERVEMMERHRVFREALRGNAPQRQRRRPTLEELTDRHPQERQEEDDLLQDEDPHIYEQETTEEFIQSRQVLSKASHRFHHTFDNDAVEAEFQTFMRAVFPRKLKVVSSMLGLLVLLLDGILLAEGYSHPWYTHVMLLLNLVLIVAQFFHFADKFHHPLVGLGAFYVECNMLLFTLLSANRSVVSNDLVYITFNFAVIYPTLGYVGGNVPYLYICVANFIFLVIPSLVMMITVKSIYVAHFHIPALCTAVWILSLRKSEMNQREHFIDKKLSDVALERTKTEHAKVSELLGRMVPSFIVEELTVWVCGSRDFMIADNFPMVGILFTGFPTLRQRFSASGGVDDPITVMALIDHYVSMCDAIVEKVPECTKLKIVGDVQLFASGLVTEEEEAANSKRKKKKNREACLVDTESLRSGSSSAHSDFSDNDDDIADEEDRRPNHHHTHRRDPWCQHLAPLAHFAQSLSTAVEAKFDGAKISAGMHCGIVTAGVIGNDRLIYDVFGDTVNTASRVMSTSGEGVWASVKFATKVSTGIKRHGLMFGEKVERQMKGKGTMYVVPCAALPT